MIVLFIILLFNTQPSVLVDSDVMSDVEFQIDMHIHGILVESTPELHYLFLTQMAESSDWIDHLIQNRIKRLLLSNLKSEASCLFDAFVDTSVSERRIQNRLESGHRCLPNSELGLALLYESESNQRPLIQQRINYQARDSISAQTLNKSLGMNYDAHMLFGDREPRLSDFYLLADYNAIQANNAHKKLLSSWYDDLLDETSLTTPQDFIKLFFVVAANHTIERNFADNYNLLALVKNNKHFSTTTQKHALFKRLVFTATALGYYQTALYFYRDDLLPLSRSIMAESEYLTVQQDYSTILFRIGDIKNALELFQHLYIRIDKITDIRYKSSLINNLAVSYLNAGFFDQYISLQLDAYTLAQQINSATYQLQILNNLFIYYKNLGDWQNAVLYLDQAEQIAVRESLIVELWNIRILKATFYRDNENDFQRAINVLEGLAVTLDKEQSFRELSLVLSELSITYEILNDYDRIVSSLKRLNTLASIRSDSMLIHETNIGLAIQQFRFGEIDAGLNTLALLNDIDPDGIEFRLRAKYYHAIALGEYHQGNRALAISQLKLILPELVNRIKFSGNIQTGSIYIERPYLGIFSFLADLYLETGNMQDAVQLLDQFKNLNKTTFLNSPLLKSSVLTEDELLTDLRLNVTIEQLRGQLLSADDTLRMQISRQLAQLQDEQNRIFNKILTHGTTTKTDLRYVISNIKNDQGILSYSLIDNQLYVSTLTKSEVYVKKIELNSLVYQSVPTLLDGIRNGSADLDLLFALAEEFVLPSIPNHVTNLVIIPDAFLYHIPVEILPITKPTNGSAYGTTTYLIERFSVSYANSIEDFVLSSRTTSTRFGLNYLGVGISDFGKNTESLSQQTRLSPLPFAINEILQSATLMGRNEEVVTLLNSMATRSQLFSYAADSRIVHIASHSEIHPIDPLFSRIYLWGNQTESSSDPLYAYELFNLRLNTELLVLSSCESGSGTYNQGSGIIGLGRALTFAGAKSLLLNAWPIRDQTASEIMTSFYTYLNAGASKSEALRLAKIDYINANNSNPAVWGSLIIFGDPDPIVEQPVNVAKYLLIWSIVLCTLLGILLIGNAYFRKER
jgi:tetratricopeptide (TPR) repeat protein